MEANKQRQRADCHGEDADAGSDYSSEAHGQTKGLGIHRYL
jgi:hypothetical protein